jgi:hypothetical protein
VIRGTIDAELDPTHQPQLSGSMLDKVDVICGAPGCDSLLNGEFELPDADVPLCTELNRLNADPEYWMSDAEQDSEFARDITDVFVNTINFCPREVPNIDDYGHFAGLNAISDLHAWQTIRTFPSASYAFAGYFGGVSQNGASLVIRIVDGADPTGPVLAETTLASLSAGGSLPWTEGSVEAVAVSDTTTVVWGSENVLGNTLMVADGLSFKVLEIVCNQPFADADGDGDVDQSDFAVFQECFTGTNNGPLPAEPAYCQCFDVQSDGGDTGDGDIDSGDLLSFENCASGPDVPADPACN